MIEKYFNFRNGIYCVILLIIVIEMIFLFEVLTIKENSIMSKGNCRVVNTKLALDNNYNILVMKQNSSGNTHLIAIDENDILHDFSKNTLMNEKSLKLYENDSSLYFLYDMKMKSFIEYQDSILSEKYILMNYLFYFNLKHKFLGFY